MTGCVVGGEEDFEADRFLPLTAGGFNVSSALRMGGSAAGAASAATGAAAAAAAPLRVGRPAMLAMVDCRGMEGGEDEGEMGGEGKSRAKLELRSVRPQIGPALLTYTFVFPHVTHKEGPFDRRHKTSTDRVFKYEDQR